MAVSIHEGVVYFEAGDEPYDGGFGQPSYNIQVKLNGPTPQGVRVHPKYETVAVYSPDNASRETQYLRSLAKGDPVQLAWLAGGKRKNMTLIVPESYASSSGEDSVADTPPVRYQAATPTWEPLSEEELTCALRIMNHEIQLLEAAWISTATTATFSDLSEETIQKLCVTAYLQMQRQYKKGMVVKPERKVFNEEFAARIRAKIESGESTIMAVMQSTLDECDTIADLEALIKILKRFGQGREAITDEEKSWINLARIAVTYDGYILQGQDANQAARSTEEELGILAF